jgi:hypothetical protein
LFLAAVHPFKLDAAAFYFFFLENQIAGLAGPYGFARQLHGQSRAFQKDF